MNKRKLVKLETFLSFASHSVWRRVHAMRPAENAYGSKTSPDWLKSDPGVLQRALIGLLTSARTTETLVRQVSYTNAFRTISFRKHTQSSDLKVIILSR